jgi:DNA-directed RNA polymerase specialized sigma24 family protein
MATSRTIREEQAYIRDRRKFLQQKRKRLIGSAGPNAFGKGQSYLDADAIHADHHREAWSVSQEIIDVNTELKELREQEYELKHHLQEVMQVVDSDCDLNFKIRVLHDFIGLNLREVAEELGMSYDRVRHVAADIKRNLK